jgi:hypothetical protein
MSTAESGERRKIRNQAGLALHRTRQAADNAALGQDGEDQRRDRSQCGEGGISAMFCEQAISKKGANQALARAVDVHVGPQARNNSLGWHEFFEARRGPTRMV